MLYEGEKIKIFPETNIESYRNWINDEGFVCKVHRDYIEVGKRYKRHQFDLKALGRTISVHRKAKGWSREKLAKEMHVHFDTIFGWEDGIRQPREEKIEVLKYLLNISAEEIEKCRI